MHASNTNCCCVSFENLSRTSRGWSPLWPKEACMNALSILCPFRKDQKPALWKSSAKQDGTSGIGFNTSLSCFAFECGSQLCFLTRLVSVGQDCSCTFWWCRSWCMEPKDLGPERCNCGCNHSIANAGGRIMILIQKKKKCPFRKKYCACRTYL